MSKVLAFRGLERVGLDEASAGDIVSLAGLPDATVAHTICAPEVLAPLPAQPIELIQVRTGIELIQARRPATDARSLALAAVAAPPAQGPGEVLELELLRG